MKIKVIKLLVAFVSLLIGFVIVHSLSPKKDRVATDRSSNKGSFFDSNNPVEAEISCMYGKKPYEIHFTAYQRPDIRLPDVNYQQAFCEKLPGTGQTLITLDFMDQEVRLKPMVLKFIRHEQSNISTEEMTRGAIMSESFHDGAPRGIIQSHINFAVAGLYTLIVEIGEGVSAGKETVRIPFEVAEGS